MAHWAKIDSNNIVVQVIKINDNEYTDEGYSWIMENLEGDWIKTSINTRGGVHYNQEGTPDGGVPFRKNYAVIGGSYDKDRDAFITPKPEVIKNKYDEVVIDYTFNEDTCAWDVVQSF
jgi:hypothetical protein